jgi:GTP cyclohydrolase III
VQAAAHRVRVRVNVRVGIGVGPARHAVVQQAGAQATLEQNEQRSRPNPQGPSQP